jgi:hypothetical protein
MRLLDKKVKEVKKKATAPTAKPKVATGKISLFSFLLPFLACGFRDGLEVGRAQLQRSTIYIT